MDQLREDVKIRDVIIGMGACTNSNYASQYNLPGTFAPIASWELLNKAVNVANEKGIDVKVGNILSSDIFYDAKKTHGKNGLKWVLWELKWKQLHYI